jgi:hypothetical protein
MIQVPVVGVILVLMTSATELSQAEVQKRAPSKEQDWLERFVGEWEADAGGAKIADTARMFGPWMIDEIKIDLPNSPMHGMLTAGYDPQKKKYVGTWIDSKTSYLWVYEGTVDASGNTLTLETEGPNPMAGGKLVKMKDVHSFTDRDHRTLTSSMQGDDGQWHTFQTVKYRRKK